MRDGPPQPDGAGMLRFGHAEGIEHEHEHECDYSYERDLVREAILAYEGLA
jgi:hypothetical protein